MNRREDGRLDPARMGVGPAGTVLTSDGMIARWQASGGRALGLATIAVTFPNITTSVSTYTAATSSSVLYTYGTPGVSESSGTVTYCTDSVSSTYLVDAAASIDVPSVFTASDVHQADFYDVMVGGTATFIHASSSTPAYPTFNGMGQTGSGVQVSAPVAMAPELLLQSTGGVGLVFSTPTVYLLIARFLA